MKTREKTIQIVKWGVAQTRRFLAIKTRPLKAMPITVVALFLFTAAQNIHADNIFVTTGVSASNIEEFTSSGENTFYASPGVGQGYLSNPTSLAFDSAGNLYVDNNGQGNILKINPSGAATIFASGLSSWSLAVDRSGNVYASEGSNIEKFNQVGVGTPFANSGQNYFFTSLAFDSSGNLFAADCFNGTIEEFNSSGVGTLFETNLNSPFALAFDSTGNLYVAGSANTIEKFNPLGVGTVFANTGPYSEPVSMTFDSEGNLFVGCLGNVGGGVSGFVGEFNSSGVGSVFTSDVVNPYGLAILAVQARITSVSASAGNLIMAGTNGVADGAYEILTSTNLTLPFTNWSPVATNTFDAHGNFSLTNAINPGTPQQYFVLKY